MGKLGIIYKVHCLLTDKEYIGQTVKILEERISNHYYKAFYKKDGKFVYNNKLYSAIRKYGVWQKAFLKVS